MYKKNIKYIKQKNKIIKYKMYISWFAELLSEYSIEKLEHKY